jgi:L-lactate dehydrogenase complex protein LldE
MPRVGLFIPCYIDQLYPHVGLATVEVLERLGVEIEYPTGQTCCGQPMANTGCVEEARPLAKRFFELFKAYDYVVCPSGSCTSMVRHHYDEYFPGHAEFDIFKHRVYELCEFIVDVLKIETLAGAFPHRVGLHNSCHGLRELRLGKSSETVGPAFNKALQLLEGLRGISFAELERPDECCGFGGTFAVSEEAVSCMMGQDRVHDHRQAGAEIITANDMSCLMHLEGLIRRQKTPLKVMHIAELLAAAGAEKAPVAGTPVARLH